VHTIEVSLPVALDQHFTYRVDSMIPPGCRVLVPFGERNRKTVGVVLGEAVTTLDPNLKLKDVLERLDEVPAYSPTMLKLARWMSDYYLYPLGEVLKSMLPASQTKTKATRLKLSDLGMAIWLDEGHAYHSLFRALWKRKQVVDSKVWKKRLSLFLETSPLKVSLNKLEKEGYVLRVAEAATKVRRWKEFESALEDRQVPESAKNLTPAQETVLRALQAAIELGPGRPYLLHGVTGAGKTEIYLQLIEEVLTRDPNAQALVLVPEIALTPQMTRVFTARFPQEVAVVHSAMSPADRWDQITLIRQGRRRILIGPRSAVFAPFARLSLLIVDEEHDASYKQGAGLSYNGRDVAVMRGALEQALVVLGSATPAMESYANALSGKYQLLTLAERVMGRAMPDIRLIEPEIPQNYAKRLQRRGLQPALLDLPVDPRILEALRENHAKGMQSMVLVNRRGFAYYLFSLRQRKSVSCPNCSISLTVHKHSSLLRCHYCDYQQKLEAVLREDDHESYVLVGYGSEQMELFLGEALPGARIQRVDSDTVTQRETLPRILEDFRSGRIDVLVGTQMLAKGHDFAKVTLICILEIDQTLNLPDFRAGERTFQLMVQAAGRAGRGEWPGQVLIQTQKTDHAILRAGLAQDYHAFWRDQEQFRRLHAYPPFARMILFEFASARRDLLDRAMRNLQEWLQVMLERYRQDLSRVQILGPAVPPIEMIRRRLRRTVLLMSDDRKALWELARQLKANFSSLPGDLTVRVDVDPQSLM
jgi:primosomal protein N' (replication factor Y)